MAFVSVPMLGSVFLPDTSSSLEMAYTLFGVLYLAAGFNEASESTATPYSKFAQVSKAPQIGSRLGMFVIYGPAFVVALAWLLVALDTAVPRAQLFTGLLAAHFAKRLAEVMFVHVYSGTMDVGKAMAVITTAYASNSYMTTRLVHAIPVSGFNDAVVQPGILLFVVGQAINAYHHVLLARLRHPRPGGAGKEKTGRYSVPTGGLFDSTTCPHFFGELLAWLGLAVVSQHVNVYLLLGGMTSYLTGRSISTTRWYKKKLPGYPERYHIFPRVF